MKAITIKQPFASLIIEGIKDVENRTWKCPQKYIGQMVLIHSGIDNLLDRVKYGDTIQFMTNEQVKNASSTYERNLAIFGTILPTGAIIGSVEVVDCVINHPSIWAEKTPINCTHPLKCGSYKTESCQDGCVHYDGLKKPIYNWVLANPIKFPEPIPCKGKLSFWDYQNISD